MDAGAPLGLISIHRPRQLAMASSQWTLPPVGQMRPHRNRASYTNARPNKFKNPLKNPRTQPRSIGGNERPQPADIDVAKAEPNTQTHAPSRKAGEAKEALLALENRSDARRSASLMARRQWSRRMA